MRCAAITMAAMLVSYVTAGPLGVKFSNWDGMKTCHPLQYTLPTNEREVSEAVINAVNHGQTIKVIGTRCIVVILPLSCVSVASRLSILPHIPHPPWSNTSHTLVYYNF